MRRVEFVIPGHVIGKGRPRFGKGHVYTPEQTRSMEEYIGWLAKGCFPEPWDGAVAMKLTMYYRSDARPDIDNVEKAILDGLQKIAYHNDKQVYAVTKEIIMSENERVEVVIEAHKVRHEAG